MSEFTEVALQLLAKIPFAQHLHLRATAGGRLVLPDEASLKNHFGTAHAGALYTLGEVASGASIVQELPDLAEHALLVVKTANIDYKRPARGQVTATGSLCEAAEAIRNRVRALGKATFDVKVALSDAADVAVATMVVTWYARAAERSE